MTPVVVYRLSCSRCRSPLGFAAGEEINNRSFAQISKKDEEEYGEKSAGATQRHWAESMKEAGATARLRASERQRSMPLRCW